MQIYAMIYASSLQLLALPSIASYPFIAVSVALYFVLLLTKSLVRFRYVWLS
jgi:hypothetical protein